MIWIIIVGVVMVGTMFGWHLLIERQHRTTTPLRLLKDDRWDEACELLGITEWDLNAHEMNRPIVLTREQAEQLGLIARRRPENGQR